MLNMTDLQNTIQQLQEQNDQKLDVQEREFINSLISLIDSNISRNQTLSRGGFNTEAQTNALREEKEKLQTLLRVF